MRRDAGRGALGRLKSRLLPFAALLIVSVALALATDRFLTLANLLDVARRVSVINIIALGMTFVIITGGIDLSVGSTSALAGVAGTWSLTHGAPIAVAALVWGGGGAPAGLLERAPRGWARLPPLVP